MAVTTEIAPNLYRISIFAPRGNVQFNHFLMKDDEPLLFHTGLRGMYAEIREAVSKLIDLSELRHISFSHFEADECGSLNEWLAAAPKADVICSQVGARVNLNDFIGRESRALPDGGTFATGKYRFRSLPDSPFAPRLGRWGPVRRNRENTVLFGPVPSGKATSNRSPLPMWWAAHIRH
jgi:flavorubredoxin